MAVEGDQAGALPAELEPHIAIEELQWREQHEKQHITAELVASGKAMPSKNNSAVIKTARC